MNIKESPEYQSKILRLQKEADESQKILAELKERGFDLKSPAVRHARKTLENRLKLLEEFKKKYQSN